MFLSLKKLVIKLNQLNRLYRFNNAEQHRAKRPHVVHSADEILPTEHELDTDVFRKLHLSDMYYFLNVPDVKLSSATSEGAVVTERNNAYAEVCLHYSC